MAGDVVFLEGLEVTCRIGVDAAEREKPQLLLVDLDAALDTRPAAADDNLARTVDYAALAGLARRVAASRPFHLVEALAEEICTAVLAAFPTVVAVRLKVSKLTAVDGVRRVGVTVERQRLGQP